MLFKLLYSLLFIKSDIVSIGESRDENNCLISAGYSWCESSNSCIRQWVTPCEDNYSDCGDCLKRQRNGENIACPMECDNLSILCENDDDCGNSYFCRPTLKGPNECVLYSKERDNCGGLTLPSYESRCDPSLECVDPNIMIADAPGICMRPCDINNYRDDFGNCVKNRKLGPILEGTHCNEECHPMPCPAPGPDCEYIPPIPDECGCAVNCGEINCYAVDPLPPPPPCSEVMCMMYCENGNQIDENGCNICACNDLPPNTNNNEVCPLPYEDCPGDYVCPKITEITHCGDGGITGYTTYQLSLIIKNPNIYNIYALFGDYIESDHQMVIPGAYQVKNVFGKNIGGVSESSVRYSRNSLYDSWLTIGITDGDINNELGSIGIDFEAWELNHPIVINNGAIFLFDPNESNRNQNEVVIGQLTLPDNENANMIINVQGKIIDNLDTWKQYNIIFNISPPTRLDNGGRIPIDCEVWFDGCNTCRVNNGVLGACTRMMCFREDPPYCMVGPLSGH